MIVKNKCGVTFVPKYRVLCVNHTLHVRRVHLWIWIRIRWPCRICHNSVWKAILNSQMRTRTRVLEDNHATLQEPAHCIPYDQTLRNSNGSLIWIWSLHVKLKKTHMKSINWFSISLWIHHDIIHRELKWALPTQWRTKWEQLYV